MSFLEQLQRKRNQLHPTCTIVTTSTGERFMESNTNTVKIKLDKISYGFVEDTKPDTVPAEILNDFLYLGSQDAVSIENVKIFKLTHVLSVGIQMDITETEINIQHKYLPLLDLPESNLLDGNIFREAFTFIEEARKSNGRILIHCNAGVSRAASIIIAYLMQKNKMNFQTAYEFVKSKRSCIQPNVGFMRQLKELEKQRLDYV